ncbi:hypothetical protein M406DRAFT_332579 [Cryphonectria parasitica EP155]|uniref:Helicase C-terminal domain-containing protein n=1 Tax=Cryphonectria parasitica (strain ATCC 38755 / EP155) TaxID=660469 RepID=A0A9P4XWB6_CRYP1|nr:uncharacterized protein M406DRAFT_332579 [Cryphonectria parasitica EP155]KAF3762193.1 hypothetical protein M406DRAFT_332579 [Cryphonectria parasitica EP155]
MSSHQASGQVTLAASGVWLHKVPSAMRRSPTFTTTYFTMRSSKIFMTYCTDGSLREGLKSDRDLENFRYTSFRCTVLYDSGLAKVKSCNPRLRAHRLETVPTTKANATQRAARAGRTKPGLYVRLYTEDSFEILKEMPPLQVSPGDATRTIVDLLVLGQHVRKFDIIDPPGD